jgi:hypothetical protein
MPRWRADNRLRVGGGVGQPHIAVLLDQSRNLQLAAAIAPAARDFQQRDLVGEVTERDGVASHCSSAFGSRYVRVPIITSA